MLQEKAAFDEVVVWICLGRNDVTGDIGAVVHGDTEALMMPRFGHDTISEGDLNDQVIRCDTLIRGNRSMTRTRFPG